MPLCLAALWECCVQEGILLDVGSPKLAPLWLGEVSCFSKVLATDISDYFVCDFEQISRCLSVDRVSGAVLDAVQMPFDDDSLSAVLSVSVVEHIAGEGDVQAMTEIARTLRPGGVAVVSVPFWKDSLEESIERGALYWEGHTEDRGAHVFYQRRYSMADLECRLVKRSGLMLEQLYLVGERPAVPGWGSMRAGQLVENWQHLLGLKSAEICSRLRPLFNGLPQYLHLFHSARYHYFCRNSEDTCALLAVLVLRKPL